MIKPKPGDTVRVSMESVVDPDGWFRGMFVASQPGDLVEVVKEARPEYRPGDIADGSGLYWVRNRLGTWHTANGTGGSADDSDIDNWGLPTVGNVLDFLDGNSVLECIKESLDEWVDRWGVVPKSRVDFYDAWKQIKKILEENK